MTWRASSVRPWFQDPTSRLFFLYGGEASTQIARDLAEKAAAMGFNPRLMAMDNFKVAHDRYRVPRLRHAS
jgi:hypothetical protein